MNEDNIPTNEQLKEEWLSRRQEQRQRELAQAESHTGDPQQAQRDIINQKPQASYESMRLEWDKRRGIVKNDATFDTGMTTDEERQYQKLKNEWYARQGKRSPEAMRKKWDQRLQNDEKKV